MASPRPPAISWKTADVLKTAKNGAPFVQDLFDIFASLMLSLELGTYRQFFRRYDNSFLLHSAVAGLHSLKVPKVTRKPDALNPFRTVVTSKIATYSMNHDAAENVIKLCIKARLIEDATNPRAPELSTKSIYVITPKGLHVVERYAQDNGIDVEHLSPAFATQPICTKLLYFSRRSEDDHLALSLDTVLAVFGRFAGDAPNLSPPKFNSFSASEKYRVWSKGILLSRGGRAASSVADDVEGGGGHDTCFPAASAVEWLCDFTSISGKAEAANILAHFVLYGLIALVHNQNRTNDPAPVKVADKSGDNIVREGTFFMGSKAVYKITAEGQQLVWNGAHKSTNSSPSLSGSSTADLIARPPGLGEPLTQPSQNSFVSEDMQIGDAASDCLRDILHDSDLRDLFRSFSNGKPFDDHLSFVLGYGELKHTVPVELKTTTVCPSPTATRLRALSESVTALYDNHIRRWGLNHVHLDDDLRRALSDQFRVDRDSGQDKTVAHLQETLGLYQRVQSSILRLLSEDVLPEVRSQLCFVAIVLNDLSVYENPALPILAGCRRDTRDRTWYWPCED
ncbi:hypothetical protein PHLGIDRAFT_117675 [Phlebiopsis gigantea 11061_1 CR5-6]|uniref:RGS domain-containing protein n=1 Tax=Phlebiopsis gigantea (strain 11061_1 CR5-6) TaxID=745531 RepID=A0A0C3S912_PHLG1|nr:hypothetical protein PHLGIDRAFT_117675 [Phlebiopsis gigantea 11061_1 CR5-6]